MATILVVDDEMGIRALLSEILADEGHAVELAENASQARAARERMRPDLVLLDIWMPDVDGITLLKEWGATGLLTMPVIMMSGHGTIDTAVEATKYGAMAFRVFDGWNAGYDGDATSVECLLDSRGEAAKGSLLDAAEVAQVVLFMLTRPRGMTIRDVVMLPTQFDL